MGDAKERVAKEDSEAGEGDVLGTKISPPSNAKTSPAPLDVHTEYLSPLRAASFSLDHCDHHP